MSEPRQAWADTELPEGRIADALLAAGVSALYGVPDTGLSGLFAALERRGHPPLITPNEGIAIACAAGAFIADGSRVAVLMQNSGLGVSINPMLSLVALHRIPLVLLIGLRGDSVVTRDEPQHRLQGRATGPILDACGVAWSELRSDSDFEGEVARACATAAAESSILAMLLPRDLLGRHSQAPAPSRPLDRDQAVEIAIQALDGDDFLVASTGLISRSVNIHIESGAVSKNRVFLNVGAMGYASAVATEIARRRTRGRVVCLDGDGALLMHLGAAAMIGNLSPARLIHVVLNNGRQESVGGFRTSSPDLDYVAMARSLGYRRALTTSAAWDLQAALEPGMSDYGPSLIDVRIGPSRSPPPARPRHFANLGVTRDEATEGIDR